MTQKKNLDLSSTIMCPCCSGKVFKACCAPIISDPALAQTPEQLMRSRYCAYALKDAVHLLRTWENTTRPTSLTLDSTIVWLNLIIDDAPLPAFDEDFGYVVFQASFIESDNHVVIREKSIFIRKNNLWFYHQGELTTQKTQISLKHPCPCGSGKKYKRCCRP